MGEGRACVPGLPFALHLAHPGDQALLDRVGIVFGEILPDFLLDDGIDTAAALSDFLAQDLDQFRPCIVTGQLVGDVMDRTRRNERWRQEVFLRSAASGE